MSKLSIFSAVIIAASVSHSAWGQHSDVIYGYDDRANPTAIVIENEDVNSDGIQFYESEFELLDPAVPGDFGAVDPGFENEAAENLLFNAGDNLFVRALDAAADSRSSIGVGFVNYFNPATQSLEAAGRLAVIDNTPAGTVDFVLDGAAATGDELQFIGTADTDGELHDHIVIDLLDDATAPVGAYGVLLEIHAVQANGAPTIVSDPLWFLINNGLSEEEFEGAALGAFGIVEGQAVPEPTALALLFSGATCLVLRRRR